MSPETERGRGVGSVSRRALLATTGLLGGGLLVGCLGFGRTGEETTLRLREPGPANRGVAVPTADLRADQTELVEEAVTNATATAHGYRPFRGIEYVRHERTYYRVRTEEAGTEVVDTTVLVVTPTDDPDGAVPLDEYDGHVIELVAPLTGDADSRPRPLYPDENGYDALYPEPRHEYVTWEGDAYRLSVETRRLEQQARRVRVELVASSDAAFETHLREDLVGEALHPADFSETARGVFRQAVEDEYSERDPYSDAFRTVLDAVQDGYPVETERVRTGTCRRRRGPGLDSGPGRPVAGPRSHTRCRRPATPRSAGHRRAGHTGRRCGRPPVCHTPHRVRRRSYSR